MKSIYLEPGTRHLELAMSRIALLAPTHLPSRRANTIQVMKMAEAIARLGHEVHLWAPRPRSKNWGEPSWEDLAHHYGLSERFPVAWLPARPALRSYDYGIASVRAAARWGADLIYTRHPQAAAIASQTGQATILEVHDLPGGVLGPWLFRGFLRGRGARRLVSITQALANDLIRTFSIPPAPFLLTLPDGVDLQRYDNLPSPEEARASLGLPRRFTAGYTGHFYPGRGVELLLSLAKERPDVHFLLVGGEPNDLNRLRKHTSDLTNVTLTGFVPNADLPTYQAACDVLLMPYQDQVAASSGGNIAPYLSPMKLFEYLASRRPILSSNLPVLREVLDERCAILLPPRDAAAWTAALDRLAGDPSLRQSMGARGGEIAREHSWDRRAAALLDGLV